LKPSAVARIAQSHVTGIGFLFLMARLITHRQHSRPLYQQQPPAQARLSVQPQSTHRFWLVYFF